MQLLDDGQINVSLEESVGRLHITIFSIQLHDDIKKFIIFLSFFRFAVTLCNMDYF
jgi:hypothetical protein